MRKFLLLLVLSTFVSCTVVEITDPLIPIVENDGRTLLVSANDATTKLSYNYEGDAIKLIWELDDLITIYDQAGERVSDFRATTIKNGGELAVFEMVDTKASPLINGESYTAIYPKTTYSSLSSWERIQLTNTTTQIGSTLDHLKSQCVMRDDFTYSETSNSIFFEHLRSIIITKMSMPEGASAPNLFTFTDGENQYIQNLTDIQSEGGVYTMITPINPNSGLRRLSFNLTNGTDVSKAEIQTSVDYLSGLYYTADLSVNLDNRNIIFPNQNLKQALLGVPGLDANSDGNISYAEAAVVRSLDLSNKNLYSMAPITRSSGSENPNSIDELNFFPNLEDLNISGNGIENLSEIPCADNLKTLDVSSNELILLDVSSAPNLEPNGLVCGDQTLDDNSSHDITVIMTNSQVTKKLIDKSNEKNSYITELSELVEIPFSNEALGRSLLYFADLNYDGKVTFEEVAELEEINLAELYGQLTAADMRYFPNLKKVSFSNISDYVDLSPLVKLTSLNLSYTDLSKVNISKNTKLTEIVTYECTNFTQFTFQKHTGLKTLRLVAVYNPEAQELTNIDLSVFPDLEALTLQNHSITEVDVRLNPNLKGISLENIKINSINLKNNSNLESITITDSNISSLDLSNITKPRYLILNNNNSLTSLDASTCTKVERFEVSNCGSLSSLELPNSKYLEDINVRGTRIPSLDISSFERLWYFNCYNTIVRITIFGTKEQKERDFILGNNYTFVVK